MTYNHDWSVYTKTVTVTANAAGLAEPATEPREENERIEIDFIAAELLDNSATELRLQIKRLSEDVPILEQATPAADTLYDLRPDKMPLAMGESVSAKVTGATDGDRIRLMVRGRWAEI